VLSDLPVYWMYTLRIDPKFIKELCFDCQVVILRLQHFLWYIYDLYYSIIAYHDFSYLQNSLTPGLHSGGIQASRPYLSNGGAIRHAVIFSFIYRINDQKLIGCYPYFLILNKGP